MRISVVTPTYNRASFLPETIESVLLQGYANFEHIVVDDGSTDNSAEILSRFPHLVVICQKNSGEPAAVNAGLAKVTGDVLVIVNSDDPLFPEAFSEAAKAFEKNPQALLAYPDWAETNKAGDILRVIRQRPNLTFEILLRSFNVSIGPATFFRRAAIERVGLRRLDRKYTGDLDLWMRIAATGTLVHIPKVLGTHRVHDTAAMSTSRGWRMSWELAQLARDSLAMPHSIPHLQNDRNKILSYAHFIAAKYSGRNPLARGFHLVSCWIYAPKAATSTWAAASWLAIRQAPRRVLVQIFRYLYKDQNLSVRRTIKDWFVR